MRFIWESSLHAQRCFLISQPTRSSGDVFSACAEMFLGKGIDHELKCGLLCMRRDVSEALQSAIQVGLSSLHAQRCFRGRALLPEDALVFSACAEMFPGPVSDLKILHRLLCMRRDVSGFSS